MKEEELLLELEKIKKYFEDKKDFKSANQIELAIGDAMDYYFNL